MKIVISFTPREVRQAQRAQTALMGVLGRCRVHSKQRGGLFIVWLTFHE